MNNINSYTVAQDILNGRRVNVLAPNTVLVDCGDSIELTFHNQSIAKWFDGGFELIEPDYMPAGRLSNTTLKRLNAYCPEKCRVNSSSNTGTFLTTDGNKVRAF